MLTIQPKMNQVNLSRSHVNFKGDDATIDPQEARYYEEKQDYYKQQVNDFDNVLNDEHTPEGLKKVINVFKVISEALLEGWAVTWGAKKGANVIKKSVMKGANSDLTKRIIELAKPFVKRISSTGEELKGIYSSTIDYLMKKPFISENVNKIKAVYTRLENNKYTKPIISGFKYIGKGIKFVATKALNVLRSVKARFEGKKAEDIYDSAAQTAANVMGTGAGVAGAYRATIHPEADENNQVVDDDIEAV